ncbi:MAG TPA: DUF6496 domain-containing protein [Polyangiaceae bacterium]|nr:DUF6496 domain-containing protein [Polyangiaceae bacterium]
MPEVQTMKRARRAKAQGKAPSTQASEFVREEIEHVRAGKHGARSAKQAIAIGLSKARRAGVALPPPKAGTTSERTRHSAARDTARGQSKAPRAVSPRRSRATTAALKREGHAAGSAKALGQNARAAAARKSPAQRSASARRAVRTKGPAQRKSAARKAARTRRSGKAS